ncbi:MAG: DUF1517 domain-containing protein [Cyanobacteria bacterium J06623_7]
MIFKRNWLKPILALVLVGVLVFGSAGDALAARTGGRIGGGSFRAPSRSYSTPRGGGYGGGGYYRSPGYGYGGGGFGFPFLLPFFGYGGGGLFSILIFLTIASFIVRSFQSAGFGGDSSGSSSQVAVAEVKVGLLANARELQPELNRLALTADTSTAAGRATVLQEATLALLRHPEYWVYGVSKSERANLEAAEAKFNQFSLTERSKFTDETLSNVNSVIDDDTQKALGGATKEGTIQLKEGDSGEYIVATVIVGATGRLDLPKINGSDDLRQALQQIGGLGSDRLLAVEILWTPQAEGDTLTNDDILAYYPNLKLV